MTFASTRPFIPLLGLVAAVGCGAPAELEGRSTGRASQAFINGTDDRQEYFELGADTDRAALAQIAVALVPRTISDLLERGETSYLPTWGEVNDLCAGEPFAEQPAAAFCSGILVDWNLVLTSGHCVDLFAPSDYRIVFGYYYLSPGELVVSADDVYEPRDVLASRRDPSGQAERLDFAWIRLKERVRFPHQPAAVQTRASEMSVGQPVISIGAGGGVPIKFDGGGQLQDLRSSANDYFIADTDTSEGSSGGGLFDDQFALLGTLARGASDFVATSGGCWSSAQQADPAQAIEQFTYAHRAVEALCATGVASVLCDADCEQPCAPLPRPPDRVAEEGCALFRSARTHGASRSLFWLSGALLALHGRARRRLRRCG